MLAILSAACSPHLGWYSGTVECLRCREGLALKAVLTVGLLVWVILVILVLGKESPGATKAGGILLFYFQLCFLRHEGLQIRCISEAYLVNVSLLIQAEQKPSNLLRSIHQEPYLPMSQFGSWQLPLGASRHQLPISPLCAFPQSPCGHRLPATSVTASALHAGEQARAAACSAASQHPRGLHLCCGVTARRLHPPHTHKEPGIWPEPRPEQGTLTLPGPRNGEHFSFFMGY